MSSLGVSRIGNNLLISRDLLITGSCKRHPGRVDRSPTPQIEFRHVSTVQLHSFLGTKQKQKQQKERKQSNKRKEKV